MPESAPAGMGSIRRLRHQHDSGLEKKQMEAVTHQTERAALDLMVHLRALTSPATTSGLMDTSANLSKIVMAMQFQDLTQ